MKIRSGWRIVVAWAVKLILEFSLIIMVTAYLLTAMHQLLNLRQAPLFIFPKSLAEVFIFTILLAANWENREMKNLLPLISWVPVMTLQKIFM